MSVSSFAPEILARMESLELRARTLVESVLTGSHRSQTRGFSIDFAEHRDYSPGDDIRFLDWKLYGKRDRFYVRQFEAENQLQAWFLLDKSGSMNYQSSQMAMSKLEYAACQIAALAWVGCYQQDLVGFLSFDETLHSVSGPVTGTTGALKLIADLEVIVSRQNSKLVKQSSEKEAWGGLLGAVERIPSRSVVFLATDAFGETNLFKRALSRLRNQKCDVRLLHVLDPAELTFPFEGNTLFRDLEGGGDQQARAQTVRLDYLREFARFLKEIRQIAGESNSLFLQVETSQPLDLPLRRVLSTGSVR